MSLETEQRRLLQRAKPADILHGTRISQSIIEQHIPGGILADFGGASGENSRARELAGFRVMVFDVNPEAVLAAKKRGLVAVAMDLRHFAIPAYGILSAIHIEMFKAIIMEGLCCNVVDDQGSEGLRRVMQTAHILNRPDGYMFIADVLHPGDENLVMLEHLGNEEYRRWQSQYAHRLDICQAAGLPENVAAVLKPGLNKTFEWCDDPEVIKQLIKMNLIERYVQYLPRQTYEDTAFALGYRLVRWEYQVWYSRTGPLSGFIAVFQKGDRFAYHPVYHGMTLEERAADGGAASERVLNSEFNLVELVNSHLPQTHQIH